MINSFVLAECEQIAEFSEGFIILPKNETKGFEIVETKPLNDFELRRMRKAARYEELAQKARKESESAYNQSHAMVSVIPMGQPILVGHHSEKRHRNLLDKSWNKLGQSVKLNEKADYYERKAEAVATNNAIFSDDPNVVEKLEEEIARLEERQALMVKANKLIRKNDKAGLTDLGFSESSINKLFQPDFCNRIGFADYQLTNNSANIRRLKQRLANEQKKNEKESSEIILHGVTIAENVEENRVQVFFNSIPKEEIRTALKKSGFRWSPSNKAWQRHLNEFALWQAKEIINKFADKLAA